MREDGEGKQFDTVTTPPHLQPAQRRQVLIAKEAVDTDRFLIHIRARRGDLCINAFNGV